MVSAESHTPDPDPCRYPVRLALPATITVTCSTSRSGGPATEHPVTINSDWGLATGHDLAAERLAAALGGYLSCLELADRTLPAVRRWLCLQHRCQPPHITSAGGRAWTVAPAQDCCRRGRYDGAAAAADHARSVRHVAAATGAPVGQLEQVVSQLSLLPPPFDPRDDRLRRLWRCGIRPEAAAELEAEVSAGCPMPADFHLAVLSQRPDLGWLREAVAARRCDGTESVWIAEHAGEWWVTDRRRALGLLALPIPPRLALALCLSGYSAAGVRALAAAHGGSPTWAAGHLVSWSDNGFHPTAKDLAGVFASAAGPAARCPAARAVALARQRHPVLARLSPTQAALAIARHGSAAFAARAAAADT